MTWFKEKVFVSSGAKQLLGEIVRVLQELFNYPHCAILLADSSQELLYVVSSSGYRKRVLHNFRITIGKEGITGWVAKHKKPLYVPDVRKDPRYIEGVAHGRSEIAVPLLIGKKLIGVLDVESQKLGAYSVSRSSRAYRTVERRFLLPKSDKVAGSQAGPPRISLMTRPIKSRAIPW